MPGLLLVALMEPRARGPHWELTTMGWSHTPDIPILPRLYYG